MTLEFRLLPGAVPVAVVAARDVGPGVWSADADGTLRAWRDGRVVRAFPAGRPLRGLDVAHGVLATWDAQELVVHALPGEGDAGEVLGRWRIDSAIQHAVITGPGQVEAYTVEVSGPPYDRCGHRRRMTAGAPGVEVLATAWGMPPPLGAVGVQPQPTPGGPAVLAEGPMGRVELVDPYGPHAHVRVQRNGGGAFRLQGPGKETRGAALMMGPGGGVLAWDGDLLWWCADGAGTCASVPAADVVSAAGDTRVGGALVLLHRGVGWAVTG